MARNPHANESPLAANGSTTGVRNKSAAVTKKVKTTRRLSVEGIHAKYPRHSVDKVLRIPRAVLEQNAGKDCTDREVAKFVGVGFGGPWNRVILRILLGRRISGKQGVGGRKILKSLAEGRSGV